MQLRKYAMNHTENRVTNDLPDTNRYLEKLAMLAGVKELGKSLGRVAGKSVRAFGNQLHLASGGTFREYAQKTLGVTDVNKLMNISGSKAGIKALKREALSKAGGPMSISGAKQVLRSVNRDLPDLRRKQLDARIITGGTVGLGLYGYTKAKRAKEKLESMRSQSSYYNTY